jgi:diguanylate cyclase (GGDEF)-like protein
MHDIEPNIFAAGKAGDALAGTPAGAPASGDAAKDDRLLGPLLLSAKVAAIVCIIEVAIILALSAVPVTADGVPGAILQSVLLSAISAPLILMWVIRPYIAERRMAFAQLAAMNRMLRQEVDERMAAEEKLRAREQELELQIQEIDYVKQLIEEQASNAVGLAEDLAMQKQAVEESERRNEHLANHDGLTSLPNRRRFEQMLTQMKEAAQAKNWAITLMFVDLDNFKTVNDTMGHLHGDEILVKVADQLRASVRGSDFVARLGGDEFAVILTHAKHAGTDQLLEFAERIRTALTISVDGPNGVIPVSAALGIATFAAAEADDQLLLKCADRAMYAAKDRGRNCIVFHHEVEAAAVG